MARSGITKYDVEKARQTLMSKELNPSIDAIRVELGNTGSKTTISRYLRDIESEESVRLDDEALLSEGIKELIAKLAAKLHQEAHEIVEQSESTHRATIDELKVSYRELTETEKVKSQSLESANSEIEMLKSEIAKFKEHASEVESKLLNEQSETQKLRAVLAEKDSQIVTLKDNHQHARDSLVHYRESVKEQREQEQRQHEQQIQQLQNELRQLNQTLVMKQTDITQLYKDNSRLVTELRAVQKDNRKLESKVKELSKITDNLKQELNQTLLKLERTENEKAETAKLRTTLDQKLELESKKIRDLELENTKLETELRMLRDSAKSDKS